MQPFFSFYNLLHLTFTARSFGSPHHLHNKHIAEWSKLFHSQSSLRPHYLPTDMKRNICSRSLQRRLRTRADSWITSPCGPSDTSCKSKWMPTTLLGKKMMWMHRTWRLLVRKHHMAPYACLSEPKIYLWKGKIEIHMSIFSFI